TPGFLSFYVTNGVEPGGPSTPASPLEVFQGDAGLLAFPGGFSGGINAGPAVGTVSSSGKTEYETTLSLVNGSALARFDLTGTDTTGATYVAASTSARVSAVVSSDTFVVWSSTPSTDAGSKATYVCPPPAPCSNPTAVTGLGEY